MTVYRPILWQTLRLLAACGLSWEAAVLFHLAEGYWALITAVVVTQPGLDDTLAASRTRVTGTLAGAVAGFAVLEGARWGYSLDALFWCALLPLAALTAAHASMRLSCITLIVVTLIPGSGPAFVRPLDRVYGILLGTAASIIVSAVTSKRFFFEKKNQKTFIRLG